MTTNATPEYMREWRKTAAGREYLRKQKAKERARRKAANALIARYPEEYRRLLTRFYEIEGIDL